MGACSYKLSRDHDMAWTMVLPLTLVGWKLVPIDPTGSAP